MSRVLVTGSRDWTDEETIHQALDSVIEHSRSDTVTLLSGACPRGADRIAERYFESLRQPIERFAAQWEEHGKAAGFIRNKQMVDAHPDICLAFIRNNSKGATHTASLAQKAGILTHIYKENTNEY